MRTLTRLAGLIVGVLILSACSGGSSGTSGGVAATVNGTEIAISTVEGMVEAQVANSEDQLSELSDDERNEQVANLQRNVLTGLISVQLVDQLAEERGVEVTDEDVQARWEEEIGFQGGEEQLQEVIADLGLTEEQARRQLRAGLQQEAIQAQVTDDIDVSDDEVRAAFEEQGGGGEQVRASHILLETQEEADEVRGLLEDGADFAELAMERSTGPSGPEGGALGLAPRGSYVQAFEDAVWNAEAGELVGPVETEFGFHVILVEEFVTTTFEDQADTIREELAGQRAQGELNEIFTAAFADAEVTVDSRFGEWDAAAGQVVPEGGLAPQQGVPGGTAPGGTAPVPGGTEPAPAPTATP